MNRLALLLAVCAAFALGACKKKAEEPAGGGSAPTTAEAPKPAESAAPSATATATTTPVQGTPVEPAAAAAAATTATAAAAAPLQVESKDILSREPVTQAAQVRHILLGWSDLAKARDPRAMARTKDEADRLAMDLLAKVKGGMNMQALMSEHSEDPGSAQSGEPYAVRPTGDFVPEFEALSLRLNVGEAGICRTIFGYHIIKRVQ